VTRVNISVALSVWNGGRYLEAQLDSIARQSRLPDELVVRDDHSSDDSLEIVERFEERVPFSLVLLKGTERLGSTRSFEIAMAACSGDIVALCDQDDVWSVNKLRRIEEEFTRRPEVGLVFSNAALIDRTGRRLPCATWDIVRHDALGRWVLGRRRGGPLLCRFSTPGCTIAYRTMLNTAIFPFPEVMRVRNPGIHHDRWLLTIVGAAAPISAIPDELVAYRLHAEQQLGFGPLIYRLSRYRLLRLARLKQPVRHFTSAVGSGLSMVPVVRAHATYLPATSSVLEARTAMTSLFEHLATRRALPRRLRDRWPVIARAWADGSYHRLANGLTSVAIDLVQPRRRA
jgi:glycosyltransferase involved in cell wall biosynthesis